MKRESAPPRDAGGVYPERSRRALLEGVRREWVGLVVGLVLYCAIAALANVPKHSGWIEDISDPKAPWLHRRRARRLNIEFSGQIKPVNVSPPSVKIIDHELHHKVFSPVLLIMALKYETAGTSPEDRYVSVEKFFEAYRLLEVLAEIEVFCGHEWAGEFCSARNLLHRFLLQIRTGPALAT